MVGIVVWIASSAGLAFGLVALGLFPEQHPGSYAASLFCVFAGMGLGGMANQFIRDRFPKFDRWNCP